MGKWFSEFGVKFVIAYLIARVIDDQLGISSAINSTIANVTGRTRL